jgi:serine phosphatase RsbU (regulator of sigma subunit)
LGWFEDLALQAQTYQLEPDDVLVLYTDGLTEAENLAHEPYGADRLVEVVADYADASAAEILDAVVQSVQQFIGEAPPFDDMTLVVIRYTGD